MRHDCTATRGTSGAPLLLRGADGGWRVGGIETGAWIGHAGGLTKNGTRPRFKLAGGEAEILRGLLEVDAALAPLGLEGGKWVREPVAEEPFGGRTPLAFMIDMRLEGIRGTLRFILRHGLRMSMAT